MLCGLLNPSGGTAKINGFDLRRQLRLAQQHLGLCPQRNTLVGALTVTEHLWLFAKLRGVSDRVVYRYVDQMIADLELVDKRHATTKTLSGGMKRKLCCGMALVGRSPVVILDVSSMYLSRYLFYYSNVGYTYLSHYPFYYIDVGYTSLSLRILLRSCRLHVPFTLPILLH